MKYILETLGRVIVHDARCTVNIGDVNGEYRNDARGPRRHPKIAQEATALFTLVCTGCLWGNFPSSKSARRSQLFYDVASI